MEKALFSSEKQNWETPQKLFDELDKEFNFDLDAMASLENAKCANYFTEEQNALDQDWTIYSSIFINPPYDSKLQDAVLKKALDTFRETNNTIVLLIPARTDTRRWHDYIFPYASDIRFLRGRLKFETNGQAHDNSAPFPSAIIIFKGK